MENAEPLVKVEDLNVTFLGGGAPVLAVRGVSFTLARGESLGIVGESGSGKSVTSGAVAGLLGTDALVEGRVFFEGQDLSLLGPENRRALRGPKIAMVFQEPSRAFDPIMSVENTFLETFRAHDPKVTKAGSRDRAVALLEEVHINDPGARLGSFPHQFSGGMLQRVLIALALANNPEVLVCDEPTTALDVTIQAQILALLGELKVRRGLSLLFVSHDLETVARVSDRLLVLYGGLTLESGPTRTLLKTPAHPYTRALWDSRVRRGSHYATDRLVLIGGAPPDPQVPEPGCPFAPRCPRAQPACTAGVPPLAAVSGDRSHRCLFPLEGPWTNS